MTNDAKSVSTIALLQRKDGLSDSLFSRYWRDVHGVLAARIPGFWSYTQFHVKPFVLKSAPAVANDDTLQMDGLAEVIFSNDADHNGLITSDVTGLIQIDEKNVFSRTLLYSLEAGASRTPVDAGGVQQASYILIVQSPTDCSPTAISTALNAELVPLLKNLLGLVKLRTHLLTSGDPSLWSTVPGVNNAVVGAKNSVAIQLDWTDHATAETGLNECAKTSFSAFKGMQAYRVDARHVMVDNGRPTHLGLRGLDALKTIEEAGADNQKEEAVLRCIYGPSLQAP